MATIEKIYNREKTVVTSYRITVQCGMDRKGNQVRQRMNWKPPKADMTERQLEKALNKAAIEFEDSVIQGYQLNNRQTFSEYAEYVLDLKKRNNVRPRTIQRYKELLVRINQAIGHIKLTELRPHHLNAFYENLMEAGIRASKGKAVAKVDIAAWLKAHKMTRTAFCSSVPIGTATLHDVIEGGAINYKTAEKIAAGLKIPLQEAFKITYDTRPLANKTVLEYHRLISTIMAQAEKEMLVMYNPAAKATPPKVVRSDPDYYQPDEVDRILDALENAPLKWKTITYLLIDTGARRGEIMGLKWENVDLTNGIMTIDHALLYANGLGTYEGPTKTGKNRTIRIAPESVELLKEYRIEQLSNRFKCGDRWVDSGYIFTQPTGERMCPDTITAWLERFSKENNLPHIHPHAFRHTAASTMIANGIDLVTTASELGHANATTTATIYAHQISVAKAKAGEVRSNVFTRRKKEAGAG